MESKVSKANAWGSLISVWGKILIGIFIFVISVGTAWYQIQTNATDNARQDQQFLDVMETMKREFEVWGSRSDKRYNRAMKESEELHEEDDKLETYIKKIEAQNLELYKEVWYIKGVLDAQNK